MCLSVCDRGCASSDECAHKKPLLKNRSTPDTQTKHRRSLTTHAHRQTQRTHTYKPVLKIGSARRMPARSRESGRDLRISVWVRLYGCVGESVLVWVRDLRKSVLVRNLRTGFVWVRVYAQVCVSDPDRDLRVCVFMCVSHAIQSVFLSVCHYFGEGNLAVFGCVYRSCSRCACPDMGECRGSN